MQYGYCQGWQYPASLQYDGTASFDIYQQKEVPLLYRLARDVSINSRTIMLVLLCMKMPCLARVGPNVYLYMCMLYKYM